jgi:hypothetical protein
MDRRLPIEACQMDGFMQGCAWQAVTGDELGVDESAPSSPAIDHGMEFDVRRSVDVNGCVDFQQTFVTGWTSNPICLGHP